MEKRNDQKKENIKVKKTSEIVEESKSGTKSATAVEEQDQSARYLEQGQQTIEDSKFFMSQQPIKETPMLRDLPAGYGENRIALMAVDSWWAYSYWEVTYEKIQEGLRFLGCPLDATKSVLRVYDVTGVEGTEGSNHSYDIDLKGMASNWYLNLNGPDRSFRVDIGLLTHDGRFYTLARSNTLTMPRAGMSDVVDERWMSLEPEKMYALSGGFKIGASSMALKELMEKRFQEALFSGSVSSFGSPVRKLEKPRSFWFVLDCELIVYGATEPDAQVTVSGKAVQLRPDGTFTLRYALPDGRFPIPATAKSADGKEERTITPIVQRTTEVAQPVIKP